MPPQVLARTGEERSLQQTWRVVAEKEMEGGVKLPGLWDEGGSRCWLTGTGITVADSCCPEVSGTCWIPDMPFPLIPSIQKCWQVL